MAHIAKNVLNDFRTFTTDLLIKKAKFIKIFKKNCHDSSNFGVFFKPLTKRSKSAKFCEILQIFSKKILPNLTNNFYPIFYLFSDQ